MTQTNFQRCVLLFGMPRSGTTWIGKLFDSHPNVVYYHEPDSVSPLPVPLLCNGTNPEHLSILRDRLPGYWNMPHEKVIASRPFFRKRYFKQFQWLLYLTSTYLAKISSRVTILPNIHPRRSLSDPSSSTMVWKSIESLGRMQAVREALEGQVSAIHLMRHPCGQIASTLKGEEMQKFGSHVPIYEDWPLFQALLDQSGESRFSLADIKCMLPIERLALRWAIVNHYALQAMKQSQGLVVRYEDICDKPLDISRKLFSYCELDYSSQTKNYIESTTAHQQDGYYTIKKDSKKQAENWRKQLSANETKKIFSVIKNYPKLLDYYDEK
jgi:hypothetical protein